MLRLSTPAQCTVPPVSSSPKLPVKVRSKEGLTVQASPVNFLAKVTPTEMEKMLMLSAMMASPVTVVVVDVYGSVT